MAQNMDSGKYQHQVEIPLVEKKCTHVQDDISLMHQLDFLCKNPFLLSYQQAYAMMLWGSYL
jgi:hypothetical protein